MLVKKANPPQKFVISDPQNHNKDIHPKCNDGSLDMRYRVNQGLDKYGGQKQTASPID